METYQGGNLIIVQRIEIYLYQEPHQFSKTEDRTRRIKFKPKSTFNPRNKDAAIETF